MRLPLRRYVVWPKIVIGVLGVTDAGCASRLPPAKAAADLKDIALRWQGFTVVNGTRYDVTSTIREDGAWENIIMALNNPGPRFSDSQCGAPASSLRIVSGVQPGKSRAGGAIVPTTTRTSAAAR